MSKIKKVTHTKYPTLKQMSAMSANLHQKYINKAVTIDVISWHTTTPYLKFSIYIEDIINEDFKSWPKLQNHYFRLMDTPS